MVATNSVNSITLIPIAKLRFAHLVNFDKITPYAISGILLPLVPELDKRFD